MKIWIDIENFAEVDFLKAVISRLEGQGHEVSVTTWEDGPVLDTLNLHNIAHLKIGKPTNGGAAVVGYFSALARALDLVEFCLDRKFDLGFSHGSLSQTIACSLVGLPNAVTFDYEHNSSWFFKWLSHKIIVPECALPGLNGNGKVSSKCVGYPGIKEEVYLSNYKADGKLAKKFNLDDSKVIFVIKPAYSVTSYRHRRDGRIIEAVLAHLSARKDVQILLAAWDVKQKHRWKQRWAHKGNLIFIEERVDRKELICLADAVISNDQMIVREAVVLGVPAYYVPNTKMSVVDEHLVKEGKMKVIRAYGEVLLMELAKRCPAAARSADSSVLDIIVAELSRLVR